MKRSLVFVLCLALLAGCSSKTSAPVPEMPVIDDPALLTNDCTLLQGDTSVRAIAHEKWPDSVKKLNPVSVTRESNGVFITTAGDTGAVSRGYAIAVFKPGNNAHYTITDTPYSKIYRFDFKP